MKAHTEIFDYLNHRDYLAALLKERKAKNNGASLRQLARRAGFKTPATLSMIVTGKRHLSAASAEKLAVALTLTGRRRRYLLTLARLDYTRSEAEKAVIKGELMRLKAVVDENEMDAKQYRTLSVWYYPAIYSMVGQDNFRRDAQWIAKRLGRQIKVEQVEEALRDLVDLELIVEKNGGLQQTKGALTTRDDIRDTAIFLYHKKMNELANEALELPLQDREFNGITVSIPKEQIPFVKSRIREFRKELNEYLSQFSNAGEIHQLNLQLFPLTKKIEDKSL